MIAKVPVSGGAVVRIADAKGVMAIESPDGAYLYYTDSANASTPGTLWRIPAAGGAPVRIAEGVNSLSFDVVDAGIYYLERLPGETRLQFFDLASRKAVTVAGKLGNIENGLSASSDGRTILFTRVDSSVNDLMLVENFR